MRWEDYTNDAEDIPQVKGQNAMHLGTNDNSLTDVTLDNILSNTGWTWNAKFADLDNDQWQDLLAVNGCWWDKKIYNMNCFFKNKEGQGFALAQVGAGLDDVGITHAFLYIGMVFLLKTEVVTYGTNQGSCILLQILEFIKSNVPKNVVHSFQTSVCHQTVGL